MYKNKCKLTKENITNHKKYKQKNKIQKKNRK